MKKHRKRMALLISVLVITIIAVTTAKRAQNQNPPITKEEKIKERLSKLPVVDYNAPENSDPGKRVKRRARGKKYDNSRNEIDPSSKVVQTSIHNDWEWGLASALPAAQSSAVFIGDVVDSQAYLSNDKTGVYSEFTVRVVEILKNNANEPLTTGDSIGVERQGGRVRTPSGHIQSYTVSGQGTPEVGKRYLFFVGYNPRVASTINVTEPNEMHWNVLTAYELRAGKVFPLDNAGGRDFKGYTGADISAFLNEVRRIIAEPL